MFQNFKWRRVRIEEKSPLIAQIIRKLFNMGTIALKNIYIFNIWMDMGRWIQPPNSISSLPSAFACYKVWHSMDTHLYPNVGWGWKCWGIISLVIECQSSLWLWKWFPNLSLHQNYLKACENTDCWAPHSEHLIRHIWGGAWGFALLTSSQLMFMWLVWVSHFENREIIV